MRRDLRGSAVTDSSSLAGRGLVQIALTCRDLDRARSFYRDVLGLTLLFETNGMLFFQLDGLRLMIGNNVKPDQPVAGTVLYFDAPDIDALGPVLEARGVTFAGRAQILQRTDTHELKLRAFQDPDGNALALMGMVAR
jgi:catechol 2,3-dioxygenase-like lactoylglutathione lyase family enzyme